MPGGLTLAVVLFLMLILFPGAGALVIAGRARAERSLNNAIVTGSLVFGTTLVGIWKFRGDVFSRLESTILAASGIGGANIDLGSFMIFFTTEIILAGILGSLELMIKTGLIPKPPWYLFRCRNRLKVKPGNLLQDTLIEYRRAGVRPYLTLWLEDDKKVNGECLRYSWNGKESILLRDADNPEKQTWVSLDQVVRMELTNLSRVMDVQEDKAQIRDMIQKVEAHRRVLNWMSAGYGDEVYKETLEKLRQSVN